MPKETVEIPVPVLSSVENLDELLDWLTSQNPKIMAELREARRQDLAGNACNHLTLNSLGPPTPVGANRPNLQNPASIRSVSGSLRHLAVNTAT